MSNRCGKLLGAIVRILGVLGSLETCQAQQAPRPTDSGPVNATSQAAMEEARLDRLFEERLAGAQKIASLKRELAEKEVDADRRGRELKPIYERMLREKKQNEINENTWLSRVNPFCIEGNVYKDCSCMQGRYYKGATWSGFSAQEAQYERIKGVYKDKLATYQASCKRSADQKAYLAAYEKQQKGRDAEWSRLTGSTASPVLLEEMPKYPTPKSAARPPFQSMPR